jgi:hypothetical protein
MAAETFSVKPLFEPLSTYPWEALHRLQLGPDHSTDFSQSGPAALTSLFVWLTIAAWSVMLAYAYPSGELHLTVGVRCRQSGVYGTSLRRPPSS